MTHLHRPRIHFRGKFSTNVCTANNDDIVHVCDTANVTIDTDGMSDPEFIEWMKQQVSASRATPRSSWNYYGDFSVEFRDVRVTSVELPGQDTHSTSGDSIIGQPVSLDRALMFDLDPEGIHATQITAEKLVVGSPTLGVSGKPTRSHSRWLSFGRNAEEGGFTGASAVWQSAVLPGDVDFEIGDSPSLAALATSQDGISLRYCIYLLEPSLSGSDLLERFQNGEKPMNPAIGFVVGTIGPRSSGELHSVTNIRRLVPTRPVLVGKSSADLGPVLVQTNENSELAVDLITGIPEADSDRNKVDLGVLSLRHKGEGESDFTSIGELEYGKDRYELTGGVATITIEETFDGEFGIFANEEQLFVEKPLSLETDSRSNYLQAGESSTIRLIASQSVDQDTLISIDQIVFVGKQRISNPDNSTRVISSDASVLLPAGASSVDIEVSAVRAGIATLQFRQPGEPEGFNVSSSSFANYRVFPIDDYSSVPDSDVTFEFVYQEVLRFSHLLYPAMTEVFDLSDQNQVDAFAEVILERIDKSVWEDWEYMPRTRDLSDGKRELLARYLNLVLSN